MIIAISSPPPIDKTELAEKLASQHGLRIIENPALAICKEYGFQTLYDMPEELQGEMREKLIRDHLAFLQANDNLVLKFSVFEYLADWMRWFWSNTPTEKWEDILIAAKGITSKYDENFHLDEGKSLEYDGYVWFDKLNASQIDRLIKNLYLDFNINLKQHDEDC